MDGKSKPLSKGDDSAKELIIDCLKGTYTGGFDLDSVYCVDGHYILFEYLKCDTVRPFKSHPNRYWHKNKRKFISLWNICQKLEGTLILVNYEDSREQFKVIKVLEISETKIEKEESWEWNYQQFKEWLVGLNNKALQS